MNSWLKWAKREQIEVTAVPEHQIMDENISEEQLHCLFSGCQDVNIVLKSGFLFIYCSGIAETKEVNRVSYEPQEKWEWGELSNVDSWQETVASSVFSGNLIIFNTKTEKLYEHQTANPPQRTPEESATESATKGARDGFTEEFETNIALVRKRMGTTSLKCEKYKIGTRSKTSVALMYIEDIARPEVIDEARRRLLKIQIDAIIASSQLEEALSDDSFSLVPLIDTTGRPDFAAECLLAGRFIVVSSGNPMVIIAPITLTSLSKSPEDGYYRSTIVSFQRLIRYIGWILAIFLPGFYVALLAYNFEQVPLPLLATIITNRIGLPFSLPFEAICVLIVFELFKEAGLRLPKSVGPMVTVVGGIIVGDAAIRAGITSPTVTVITATTVIAGYTLVNPTLNAIVSVIRILILLVSSTLGMFGFFLSLFMVVVYLSSLTSFGVPYLAPLSPFNSKDFTAALLKKTAILQKKRPNILKLQDDTKQPEDNR